MRVAVIGAGAVGAVLCNAAEDEVRLCVRTPIPSLELVGDGWSSEPAVEVVDTPSSVGGPADVVFVTVKATDTAGAAPWLEALCSDRTLVVVVQNGLDQAERVTPYLPPGARAVAGLAYIAAERLSVGRVRHLAGNLLVVPALVEPTVAAAVPGLRVRGSDDMLTASWQKLLGNLVANPITALTSRRIEVMNDPGIPELARGLLEEAVAVGRASGARLDDSLVEQIIAGTAQYGPDTGSSMLYDRLAGRPMEHQFLTGEVVRRGSRLGIPVPLNSAVLALLDALDRTVG